MPNVLTDAGHQPFECVVCVHDATIGLKGIGVVSTSATWTMGICERARLAII